MLFLDVYPCIEAESQGQFREKGSRFLAFAFPVNDQAEIKSKLEKIKALHPSATHHCYAWRLAVDGTYRTNDDGEPSGTAGKPIYSRILANDLYNILIVVVRYFGGTLLGVP